MEKKLFWDFERFAAIRISASVLAPGPCIYRRFVAYMPNLLVSFFFKRVRKIAKSQY